MRPSRYTRSEVEQIRADWERLKKSPRFRSTRALADWMGAEWDCSYRTIQRIVYEEGKYTPREDTPYIPRRRSHEQAGSSIVCGSELGARV